MSFEFTRERRERLESLFKIYPTRRAALLPALHLVQEQLGYVSPEGEEHVAEILGLPVIDVHEVLTFYTLYRTRPMGRRHIRLCTSISCWVRGCRGVQKYLEEKLEVASGGTTADGEYSWEAVQQCMGACELAPMMQVGDDYHGPLDRDEVDRILDGGKSQGRNGRLEIAPPPMGAAVSQPPDSRATKRRPKNERLEIAPPPMGAAVSQPPDSRVTKRRPKNERLEIAPPPMGAAVSQPPDSHATKRRPKNERLEIAPPPMGAAVSQPPDSRVTKRRPKNERLEIAPPDRTPDGETSQGGA